MPRISLFDSHGNRKYLTPEERQRFYAATNEVSKDWRAFGRMLYFTGCRISEALNLKARDIDFSSAAVTLNTLKQRADDVYRQVPLSHDYLSSLDDAFDLRMMQRRSKSKQSYLWGWSRKHGYMVIKDIMQIAKIEGIQASPKGLRHGFAIACLDKGYPSIWYKNGWGILPLRQPPSMPMPQAKKNVTYWLSCGSDSVG